jgi:hypothetical protein
LNFSTWGDTLSSVISLIISAIAPLLVAKLSWIIYKNKLIIILKRSNLIESDSFIKTYGSLTEGQDLASLVVLYWNIILFIRWYFTILILVFLRASPNI